MAHNRALALQDVGRLAQAVAVLKRCRDESLGLECWDQYARALHGLANHAWRASREGEAIVLYGHALSAARKNRLPEQAVAISVNYANALRSQNKTGRAQEVLLAVRSSVSAAPDALDYYFALGAASKETGDAATAATAYEAALAGAQAVAAADEAGQAATALAESCLMAGEFERAGRVIEAALADAKSAKERVPLLTAQLKLLLQPGTRAQAGRVFRLATRVARAEGMKEDLVDLHMMFGDYEWDHGKSRTEAMKVYTSALFSAGEIGLEIMIQTGGHSVRRLLSLPAADRSRQIEKLLPRLQTWLKGEVSKRQYADAERIALWPQRVALRIDQTGRDLSSMSKHELSNLIQEELFGAA